LTIANGLIAVNVTTWLFAANIDRWCDQLLGPFSRGAAVDHDVIRGDSDWKERRYGLVPLTLARQWHWITMERVMKLHAAADRLSPLMVLYIATGQLTACRLARWVLTDFARQTRNLLIFLALLGSSPDARQSIAA
jgi:hypothetical protein